jgi:hypothetical protein
MESDENVCVLNESNEYILFHSPPNGISIKRSSDLNRWNDWSNLITLGQDEWDWAKGRITAETAMNLREKKKRRKYILIFHGLGPTSES